MLEYGKRKGSAMNIEIAQRLYELRRKHGFSQESLAAALGLSRQAISKWERSESAPDMGNLIALADLYGITIDELIRPNDEEEFTAEIIEVDMATVSETADAAADVITDADTMTGTDATDDTTDGTSNNDTSDDSQTCANGHAPTDTRADIQPVVQEPTQLQTQESTHGSIQAPEPTYPQEQHQPLTQTQPNASEHLVPTQTLTVKPRCALRKFPYPLLVTVVFLILALVFSLWEYIWLFLTIPFYYWIARIIEHDPLYLEAHGYTVNPSASGTPAPNTSASNTPTDTKGVQ